MPTLTRRGRVTHPSKGVPPWDGHRTPSPPWAAPFRGVPSDGAHGGCTHAPPACYSSPGVASPRAPIRGHGPAPNGCDPGFPGRVCASHPHTRVLPRGLWGRESVTPPSPCRPRPWLHHTVEPPASLWDPTVFRRGTLARRGTRPPL